MGRIVGVDVARGLAVLGMFTAHLGTAGRAYPPTDVLQVADGRSAALFALLAGVSLALLSGGPVPVAGDALSRARVRIAVRAALIFVLHWPLVALGTPVLVILGAYAVMFLLALPFLRVPPAGLFAAAAGVVLLIAPPVALLGDDLDGPEALEVFVLDLVLTGAYPAVVWIAYVLVGLGVGRLDLTAARTQTRLLAAGVVLAVLGYGPPLLAGWGVGEPTTTADLLGTVEPHSDSPFELVGNIGFALGTLALCLLATRAVVGRGVLLPVAATGALALTSYTVHIVAIAILGTDVVWQPRTSVLLTFIAVTLIGTTLWRAAFGRGPFELLLHRTSTAAARARHP